MARMLHTNSFAFLGLSSVLLLAVGCVPQEKYNAMKLAHDSAMERLADSDSRAKAANAEAEAYKRQLDAIAQNNTNQGGLVTNLTAQLSSLQGDYAKLQEQYQEALNKKGEVVVLPQAVNDALTQFANQNPDLVDFDSVHGIVKFKSDVTFNSGSAELRPEARKAIDRFAQILNSPQAAVYGLQVAGHTDSTRVSNEATRKAGHFDNWYLSSHRAISVGKALQSQNVDSKRIAVVGYADQHPIASNATDAGRAQNRRVEVLILPSQLKAGTQTASGEPASAAPAPAPHKNAKKAAQQDLNKDTAGAAADQRSLLNK